MTDRELIQMALEALEWCYDVTEWPANGDSAQDKAIEALRARLAQPEPEPVVKWDASAPLVVHPHPAFQATQPQREWQVLTNEEYELMVEKYVTNGYFDTLEYARAIEAKLKEKNA